MALNIIINEELNYKYNNVNNIVYKIHFIIIYIIFLIIFKNINNKRQFKNKNNINNNNNNLSKRLLKVKELYKFLKLYDIKYNKSECNKLDPINILNKDIIQHQKYYAEMEIQVIFAIKMITHFLLIKTVYLVNLGI